MFHKIVFGGFVAGMLALIGAYGSAYAGNTKTPTPLHTAEDYLRDIPEKELDAQSKKQLLKSARVDAGVKTPLGEARYELYYDFSAADVHIHSELIIAENGADAISIATRLMLGVLKGIRDVGDEKLIAIKGLESWHPGSRYFYTSIPGTPEFGNIFILRSGTHVYQIYMSGAGAFTDPASVKKFLGTKLDSILSFVAPDK